MATQVAPEYERNAWQALAACGIQQTHELSDEFLINTFADLIRRADPRLSWTPSEFDQRSNQQRIVRALRSLHLERYLSAPQHVNPQLRQKVLASLEALSKMVQTKPITEASNLPQVTPQTPNQVFKPGHKLVRTPRRQSPRGGEKENPSHAEADQVAQASGDNEEKEEEEEQEEMQHPTRARTPARTPAPSTARPATPAPTRPVAAKTPVATARSVAAPLAQTPAPKTPTPAVVHVPEPEAAQTPVAAPPTAKEAAAFARSRKIARTPVRTAPEPKLGSAVAALTAVQAPVAPRAASPTKELTARLEGLSIAPSPAAHRTPALRRSPRRITAPRDVSPPPAPSAAPVTPVVAPTNITGPVTSTPGANTMNLSSANTQQLAAVYVQRERDYVGRELSQVGAALRAAREEEERLEREQHELDAQLEEMRQKQASLMAMLQQDGVLGHISAPSTPALTTDNELRFLKERQLALEEQLEMQQHLLGAASADDKGKLMMQMTENLAQYTAVITQITEHINLRRTQALDTKALRLGAPTPARTAAVTPAARATAVQLAPPTAPPATGARSAALTTATIVPLSSRYAAEEEPADAPEEALAKVEEEVNLAGLEAPAEASSLVLTVQRTSVPRAEFASACRDAKQKLRAERQRLLDESEQILQQMMHGRRV